jgi:hypothetical protein
MPPDEPTGPDLDGVVADANPAGLDSCAEDSPDRLQHRRRARRGNRLAGTDCPHGALPSLFGFKRLAGRPQDDSDLTELKAIYGELPVEPIPGLDI